MADAARPQRRSKAATNLCTHASLPNARPLTQMRHFLLRSAALGASESTDGGTDMKQGNESLFRRAMLPVAATAVGIGAFLGLPKFKALAAQQELRVNPRVNVVPPVARLNLTYPHHVNPSAEKLVAIASEALASQAMMERIFSEPDAVASQYGLDDNQKSVLRQMTRAQFETAQADAARVSAERLAAAGPRRLPASATDARLIAERMVVGRAILAAAGRSYLDAANAHACCPWSKSIELGVNPSRVFYNEVFEAPALNLQQPRLQVLQPERG